VPAPRSCRRCGTPLSPDVRWCGQCHEPVREFAPRLGVHDGGFVGNPRIERRTSRWQGGPTALGPTGKILATASVLLFGPWQSVSVFTLLYGPVWVLLSVIVLKEIWRPRFLGPDAPPTKGERFRERHPILASRIDGRLLLLIGVVCLFGLSTMVLGTGGSFLMLGLGGVVAIGFLLAWLSGY
jgi:hypothetical protein